jgi:hypothetical protein
MSNLSNMKNKIIGPMLFITFFICGAQVAAQDINAIKWLAGTWKITTGKGYVIEKWRVLNDSTLSGKSFFVKANSSDSLLQESLELVLRKGQWTYISTVQGQNSNQPVPFKIVFLRATEFICENPTHDYPQRIAYRRVKDLLYASIEGKKNGRFNKSNFDFKVE